MHRPSAHHLSLTISDYTVDLALHDAAILTVWMSLSLHPRPC